MFQSPTRLPACTAFTMQTWSRIRRTVPGMNHTALERSQMLPEPPFQQPRCPHLSYPHSGRASGQRISLFFGLIEHRSESIAALIALARDSTPCRSQSQQSNIGCQEGLVFCGPGNNTRGCYADLVSVGEVGEFPVHWSGPSTALAISRCSSRRRCQAASLRCESHSECEHVLASGSLGP